MSACGEETSPESADDPSQSATEPAADLPDWPTCEEVWVADADLPADYKGCIDGDAAVKAEKQPCSFGLPIVSYDDRFYAVTGHKINEVESLETDEGFQQAVTNCSG
jgi:hypothetical protein